MGAKYVLQASQFQFLFDALTARGYQVIGPKLQDGAIVYDALSSVQDLPAGWTDQQEAGTYRLENRSDSAFFGYTVGPYSWKKFLHLPARKLKRGKSAEGEFHFVSENEEIPKLAFVGVRACELHAMTIQDKIFMGGTYRDSSYAERRENIFVIAVNCGKAGGTCFCVSMKTGPKASGGYDWVLTEVIEKDRHYFVVESGTGAGKEILAGEEILKELDCPLAAEAEIALSERIVEETACQMGRRLKTEGIKDLLYKNLEHPHWDEVANRCLTCGNCTMVCPTCFCASIAEITDLTGEKVERVQKWDSCFTEDFSYIHGGSIRKTAKSRYRQWMTHKLAYWIDQFGTSGCVGCGRCITWCPAGIDITEEAKGFYGDS